MLQCLRSQVAQLKLDYSDKVRQSKIDSIIVGINQTSTNIRLNMIAHIEAMKSAAEHFTHDLVN